MEAISECVGSFLCEIRSLSRIVMEYAESLLVVVVPELQKEKGLIPRFRLREAGSGKLLDEFVPSSQFAFRYIYPLVGPYLVCGQQSHRACIINLCARTQMECVVPQSVLNCMPPLGYDVHFAVDSRAVHPRFRALVLKYRNSSSDVDSFPSSFHLVTFKTKGQIIKNTGNGLRQVGCKQCGNNEWGTLTGWGQDRRPPPAFQITSVCSDASGRFVVAHAMPGENRVLLRFWTVSTGGRIRACKIPLYSVEETPSPKPHLHLTTHGDELRLWYGCGKTVVMAEFQRNGNEIKQVRTQRLVLAGWEIENMHPADGEAVMIRIKLPEWRDTSLWQCLSAGATAITVHWPVPFGTCMESSVLFATPTFAYVHRDYRGHARYDRIERIHIPTSRVCHVSAVEPTDLKPHVITM